MTAFLNYADAVRQANKNGGTLRLLSDIEVQYEDLDDAPFITGAFTLDLNGKSIDYVDFGSYGYDEEADENIKGTPGTLTVTDTAGGEIGELTVNAGALTVEGGTTEHLYAQSYAATVDITGGTVTELALNEYEGEEVCAAVSGGSVQRVRMNGGTLTVDGGDYRESMDLLAVSGTADIVIKNGVLHNTFNTTKGGQLFVSTGNAIDMRGGSLTLDGVTLRGAYEKNSAWPNGEIQSYALELSAGDLTVENCTFIGSLAVYKVSGETSPTAKITSATLHHGLLYTVMGKDRDDNGLAMLFADSSMLFDENGKYIDVTSDSYWDTAGDEEQGIFYTGFYYENEVIVKPHEHTFTDGVCMACEYVRPHDGGNEREANYFEKAVCAICHSEYGEYVKDTTAPTGKVEIRERTWWQELQNKITFDLFYKETVTLAITGEDDSGRDVAIRYTIENAAAEDAEALTYDEEYTGYVDLSDERQYVIYAVIEDWAGNRTYLSSDGFEIDKTAPVVEVIAPVSRTLDDGGAYVFCTQRLVFRAADKNLKDVTIGNDDALMTDGDGNYVIESAGEYEFVLTDQAGNESRVRVTLYAAHDFDQATGKCRHCKADAAAKVEKRELTAWFADGGKYGAALVKAGGSMRVYENSTFSGEVAAENDGTLLLEEGTYKQITVAGKRLIDCLAESKAFWDMNNSFIIDGRRSIGGDIKVVDHTHSCVWNTKTHEKLCGCGYVEATDTEAPVISGIDPENDHYGSLEFTVTDANDFTVWMDGSRAERSA